MPHNLAGDFKMLIPQCNSSEPQTISELNLLSFDELAQVDIGRSNLLCAAGLVGSEDLNVNSALLQIDEMAFAVEKATRHYWNKFLNAPEQFENSEAYFRAMVLATVLQRDFGVTYDIEWFENLPDFTDSSSVFIHGILAGRGGTCSSLPVLFAAVGRRLDYPLKLVSAVSHLFLRWDDPNQSERFNIETTSQGLVSHSDKHYRTWPVPMRPEDLAGNYYLSSYTPQQELACFYITRAQCYFDWLKFDEAMQLAHRACELFPEEPNIRGLHAISTLLYRENCGLAKHNTRRGVVLENGRVRPITPWERWAGMEAENELTRLQAIHGKKRLPEKNPIDEAFASIII